MDKALGYEPGDSRFEFWAVHQKLKYTMKKIGVYVLNLKKDKKRLKNIVSILKKQKIHDYEIIQGIDGKKLTRKELNLAISKNKKEFNPNNTNMSVGEIGCSLSHIKIYKKFLNSKFEVALIFEDDVEFIEDFTEKLKTFILKNFKYKSQIIFLSKLIQFYKKPVDTIKNYELVKVTKTTATHSYFINRNAAKLLISYNYPVKTPADNFFVFKNFLGIKLFGINPYITAQNTKKFTSNIDSRFDIYKIFNWKYFLAEKKNKILKNWFKLLISHYY